MRSRRASMLSVKVKTEKSDLEASTARNRLDAVLQNLVEKTDVERDQTESEAVKPAMCELQTKDCSSPATGKRVSTRFPHQRRKKRKEMEDGGCEGALQRPNAYTMKLFDRSVDLAQFAEGAPLYPICRAWMRNKPSLREGDHSLTPHLPTAPEDEEGRSAAPGVPTLLYHHMERWKKIRQRWRDSSHRNQHRYRESMKILKEMFERQ
ncbi:protein lin-37 homolog isoform X3 [Narcine bancroftii]|uniref:protein lin-37 homolog isoform X3 n=1 Tax=Narcine bancroftii TaxID=1343680 RepID=UPI0038313D45